MDGNPRKTNSPLRPNEGVGVEKGSHRSVRGRELQGQVDESPAAGLIGLAI